MGGVIQVCDQLPNADRIEAQGRKQYQEQEPVESGFWLEECEHFVLDGSGRELWGRSPSWRAVAATNMGPSAAGSVKSQCSSGPSSEKSRPT